jgi:hypothetical protein
VELHYGDVVVFTNPGSTVDLVKRVPNQELTAFNAARDRASKPPQWTAVR